MSKFTVIFLIVTVCAVLSPADPGILQRIKKGPLGFLKREPEVQVVEHKVVVVDEQPPCKSDKCRPPKTEYIVEERCKSERCRTCRNDCNGNDKCHSECIVIEKCRSGCRGNERCQNDCGWAPPGWIPPPPPPPPQHENDRCRVCNSSPCQNNPPLLTYCEHAKWLCFVQIPRNIYLADFVGNPELLRLYQDSNMELDADGISGRACLSDKARLDLSRLNAVVMPIKS